MTIKVLIPANTSVRNECWLLLNPNILAIFLIYLCFYFMLAVFGVHALPGESKLLDWEWPNVEPVP